MRLRFCLDENLSPIVAECLHPLTSHRVGHVNGVHMAGVEDVNLFGSLASLDFDVLITRDRSQLENEIERDALRESRLTWIGLPEPLGRGLEVLSADLAAISLTLPEILADRSQWPRIYHVRQIRRPRVAVEEI